jgi:pilus assembly protein Flp/PilA
LSEQLLAYQESFMFERYVSEEGQGLMEYALVLVLVAIVVVAILSAFGEQLEGLYQIATAMGWDG